MSVTMELVGQEVLNRRLRRLGGEYKEAAQRQTKESTESMLRGAVQRVPKETHRGAQSLHAHYEEDGLSGAVTNEPDTFYLGFAEWGTRKQPATPFMQPSHEEERRAFLAKLRIVLKAAGRKALR